ncbi:MAG: PaaI family thioesterase [Betaproteobacteria bacterium]|nr:PaaI family thioesterase [Betaproteobacteria bacterium]MDH3437422.1 PaaI family thioesterase [Betaproteobacteria bacterium]
MGDKQAARGRKDTRATRLRSARELFRIGLPQVLGVRLRSLTPQRVAAEMRVKPAHFNRNRRVGGGVLMAFADVMGAAGAVANRPLGFRGGTLESKTNFFAAATGPALTAVSVPLHIGRTTSVWQTTIRNKGGRIIAIVTQTQMSLPPSLSGNGQE